MLLEAMRTKSRESRPPSSLATTTKTKYDPLLWPERSKPGDLETCASRLSNVTFLSLPVGKCQLDEYPMSVDRGLVTNTMTDLRRLKLKDHTNLLKASQVSATLCRQSRKMFDHALSRAGETEQVAALDTIPVQSRAFSGPTRAGSPIYNKKVQVMNAIRTRPVTVPANARRYKHERGGKMLPIIQQTLARSNEDFRVQIIPKPPVSVSPSQRSSHPDVILIPTAPPPDEEEQEEDDRRDNVLDAADEEDQKDDVSPTKAKKRMGIRSGSEARRKVKHWVDELTISSSGSNQEQQEAGQTTADQMTQGQGQEKQVTSRGVENANIDNGVDVRMGENDEINDKESLPKGENLIVTLQELQEKQLALPEFKCPSSEGKSREYAIREWLKHTSFSIGNRNVPLL